MNLDAEVYVDRENIRKYEEDFKNQDLSQL